MKKVFLPLNTKVPLYKQFPTSQTVWGDYEFVLGQSCDVCDYIVVLDTLSYPLTVSCKKGGTLCFPMEAESIKKYPKDYLHQFDTIFCFQEYLLKEPNAKMSIPPFPWMLIYDFYAQDQSVYSRYDYYKNPEESNRLDKFCVFTSNKIMSRGQCDRLNFVDKVRQELPELIDVFGSGFNNVDVKYDVMTKYKYCIVIENDKVPYWRTEKLADAILAGCYPLYYGDPTINDLFPSQEVELLDIFNVEKAINRMKDIVSENLYDFSKNDIVNAREKVLNDWNMFSIISRCLDKVNISDEVECVTINPMKPSKYSGYVNLFKQLFYSKLPYPIVRHFNF